VRQRDEPVPLRDALAAVGNQIGMPAPDALKTVVTLWPELVGPLLAPHSRVRAVRNGECTIEVDGPAWATQFRYLEPDLIAAANARCGGPVLTALNVVVKRG